MPTAILNRFNGGMTADPRDTSSMSQLCKHFDNYSKPHALTPFRSSEGITTIASTTQELAQLSEFQVWDGNLYALGVLESTTKSKIYKGTGIDNPTWTTPNAEDSTIGRDSDRDKLFIQYKGTFWGAAAGTRLWSWDGASTFTSNAQSITYTTITQGFVHPKDDILYFGYSNATATYIASKNAGGSWNLTALTLPSNLIVSSICDYGNYLAIMCRPAQVGGISVVYLWDRDSTLTTLSESIELGHNIGYVLENIDGYLIAVSITANTSIVIKPKLVFQKYAGGGFQIFKEIPLAAGVNTITSKQKKNNRLYFGLNGASVGGTVFDYTGIWSVGRNGETEPFSVSFIQLANNDTYPNAIKGFILAEDYFYVSSTAQNTNAFTLTKTNDSATYTATSVYTTVINPNMPDVDKFKKKKLQAVAVTYTPLPADGQVVLKYRVDGGNWTTVFTETTDSAQITEITQAGSTMFTDGREYEFSIESTGGAEITGLAYKYETLSTLI